MMPLRDGEGRSSSVADEQSQPTEKVDHRRFAGGSLCDGDPEAVDVLAGCAEYHGLLEDQVRGDDVGRATVFALEITVPPPWSGQHSCWSARLPGEPGVVSAVGQDEGGNAGAAKVYLVPCGSQVPRQPRPHVRRHARIPASCCRAGWTRTDRLRQGLAPEH